MDIPFPGVGDIRCGGTGGGDLFRPLSETCRSIYYNKSHYGPVLVVGVALIRSGIKAVVGTGRIISRGDTGGG